MTIRGYIFTFFIIVTLGVMWRLFIKMKDVEEESTYNLA
jgi:hypothetical protein